MKRTVISVVAICFVGVFSVVGVAAEFESSGRIENPVTVEPDRAPGDPVNLVLDDGSADNNIGIGGTAELLFLNRFTPVEFPIELTQVNVYFTTGSLVSVGDPFDVYLYENTAGNPDPAAGAVYIGGQTGNTITALDAWNTVTLASPANFSGPGDVLVAVIHRVVPGTSVFPAAIDTTATQQRSWAGWYSTPTAPDPPTLPPDATWIMIDNAGFPGNWMVRASGTVVPVELMSLTVD